MVPNARPAARGRRNFIFVVVVVGCRFVMLLVCWLAWLARKAKEKRREWRGGGERLMPPIWFFTVCCTYYALLLLEWSERKKERLCCRIWMSEACCGVARTDRRTRGVRWDVSNWDREPRRGSKTRLGNELFAEARGMCVLE